MANVIDTSRTPYPRFGKETLPSDLCERLQEQVSIAEALKAAAHAEDPGRFLPKLRSAALRQSRLVCVMAINAHDYHVVTSRTGERPERWIWEIHRKSQPLGIKMTGDGFQSESAAEFAGKKALADFLSDLAKEDKRPLK